MKIIVNRLILAQALADIMPFVPSKAPIQILKYAKFTTKGNKLKLEANNAQDSISIYIDTMECDADGMFCVDANDISRYVAVTRGNEIELTIEGDVITVRHSKGTAEFPAVSADEFPSFSIAAEDSAQLTIPSAIMSEVLQNAVSFVSKETVRPYMTAIYATVANGEFTYAASDTHKLIYAHTPLANAEEINVSWYIVPSAFKSIQKGCKIAPKVKLIVSDTKVSYRMGDTVINTVQVKGAYPNVQRVIPTQHMLDINVNRDEIADTLKRISMFCGTSRCAKLKISPMDILVSADDDLTAKKSSESVIHGGCASDLTIGMNVDYLLETLSVLNPGDINLAFTDDSHPAVLTQASKENVTIILMPMQITRE